MTFAYHGCHKRIRSSAQFLGLRLKLDPTISTMLRNGLGQTLQWNRVLPKTTHWLAQSLKLTKNDEKHGDFRWFKHTSGWFFHILGIIIPIDPPITRLDFSESSCSAWDLPCSPSRQTAGSGTWRAPARAILLGINTSPKRNHNNTCRVVIRHRSIIFTEA